MTTHACSKCGETGIFASTPFRDVEGYDWLVTTGGQPLQHIKCTTFLDDAEQKFKIDPETKKRVYGGA